MRIMQAISNRIEYIDIAKGLAIVLVVMGHILQFDLTGESGPRGIVRGRRMPLPNQRT